jgi:hypothetical protein
MGMTIESGTGRLTLSDEVSIERAKAFTEPVSTGADGTAEFEVKGGA